MPDKPLKLYIFCCSTSVDTVKLARCFTEIGSDELKVISLPCSGKVDALYLIKAFETGTDGVLVVTCKKGECRYLEGNLRAQKRTEAVNTLLDEIGMGKGRIAVIQTEEGKTEQLIREIEEFRDVVRNLINQASKNQNIHLPAALS